MQVLHHLVLAPLRGLCRIENAIDIKISLSEISRATRSRRITAHNFHHRLLIAPVSSSQTFFEHYIQPYGFDCRSALPVAKSIGAEICWCTITHLPCFFCRQSVTRVVRSIGVPSLAFPVKCWMLEAKAKLPSALTFRSISSVFPLKSGAKSSICLRHAAAPRYSRGGTMSKTSHSSL